MFADISYHLTFFVLFKLYKNVKRKGDASYDNLANQDIEMSKFTVLALVRKYLLY